MKKVVNKITDAIKANVTNERKERALFNCFHRWDDSLPATLDEVIQDMGERFRQFNLEVTSTTMSRESLKTVVLTFHFEKRFFDIVIAVHREGSKLTIESYTDRCADIDISKYFHPKELDIASSFIADFHV